MAEGEVHGIEVKYVPPVAPPPGKIHIRAPLDKHDTPVFPHLSLAPEVAEQLMEALSEGLRLYMEAADSGS